MQHLDSLIQTIRDVGLAPPENILVDGCLHRYHVDGDGHGSKNGWYIVFDGDPTVAVYGCWKRNVKKTWCSKAYEHLSQTDHDEIRSKMLAAKQQREIELSRVHAECRSWCLKRWESGQPAFDSHPYLLRKGIPPLGLKLLGNALMIPVTDCEGIIHGMQLIQPDGTKTFKTGTQLLPVRFLHDVSFVLTA